MQVQRQLKICEGIQDILDLNKKSKHSLNNLCNNGNNVTDCSEIKKPSK